MLGLGLCGVLCGVVLWDAPGTAGQGLWRGKVAEFVSCRMSREIWVWGSKGIAGVRAACSAVVQFLTKRC